MKWLDVLLIGSGLLAIFAGALMIHPGLGLIAIGVLFMQLGEA